MHYKSTYTGSYMHAAKSNTRHVLHIKLINRVNIGQSKHCYKNEYLIADCVVNTKKSYPTMWIAEYFARMVTKYGTDLTAEELSNSMNIDFEFFKNVESLSVQKVDEDTYENSEEDMRVR